MPRVTHPTPTSPATQPFRKWIPLTGAMALFMAACGGGGGSSAVPAAPPAPPSFLITNLVSDQATTAATTTDSHLVNPWGLAYGPTTSFWVANQGTDTTTVYDGLGAMPATPIVVSSPSLVGHTMGGPTGVAYNGGTGFNGDRFLLASLDGCICGWSAGAATIRRVDNSASGAVYTGLALGTSGTTTYAYATNFTGGTIDVFDVNYAPVNLGASALVDPTLPTGYAPFNVRVMGGQLYVTYAMRTPPALRETIGAGLGVVSVFTLDGTFVHEIAAGGQLNAPWGMALAPVGFGPYGGALLVGNFGDGRITAFNAATGAVLGQMADANHVPLSISGLWALTFGNDGSAGRASHLYVTAGPAGETHGLFAAISYGPFTTGTGGGTGTGGY